MKISQEFVVGRPIDKVWDFFQDVPEVARCLPGAELLTDEGDGVYTGKLDAKLGPMTVSFDGKAAVTVDSTARTGMISGSGADRRGGSRGKVKVEYALHEGDGGTSVTVDADVQLSGPAAQFGRVGLIKEVSARLIEEFVVCLEAKLVAATPEEAEAIAAEPVLQAGGLFFGSLWAVIVRFLKRLAGRSGAD